MNYEACEHKTLQELSTGQDYCWPRNLKNNVVK